MVGDTDSIISRKVKCAVGPEDLYDAILMG